MKFNLKQSAAYWTGSPPSRRAFTVTELLVAGSVFLMVVAGVLLGNSFGMRMVGITQPKLAAAGRIRNVVSQLYSDINSAKFTRVGNGNLSSFTAINPGGWKQGNAIEIYPTSDTNVFIRYYRDAADKKLKRMTNGSASASIVANAIVNNLVFTSEGFDGIALTNNQSSMAIGVRLQYYQLEGTATPIGATNYYKTYVLNTRVACRAH
jgi:hypothetical protein